MNDRIDAVLVDTSVYHKKQCDFEGITNSIIPMLLQLLRANNIKLLSHPILMREIKKHIGQSELISRINNFQSALRKYNKQLQMIGTSAEELNQKLEALNMEKRLTTCFEAFYEYATVIPDANVNDVFDDYFNARPPFRAEGEKKHEFPDAFILKGLKKYCENNPDETILVISDDSDWKNALEGNKQVIVISDLEAAMVLLWEQLDDKAELFQMLLSKMNKEICSEIKNAALCEAFCIDAIDSTAEGEIKDIKVSSIKEDVIPLDVEADCVLLQITATLDVDGYSEFLDEDHSVWDDEERCYYFCAYTHLDFYHASADVDCEVKISFSDDGSLSNIKLVSTKLLNKWDIDLDLEEAEIEERNMVDYSECEDGYRTERAEAQEEYYRH